MATATMSKTDFVRDFLGGNPQSKAKAVNEAWQAAGFDGTISHPTVSEVRKELGLIGTQPGRTSKRAKKTSAPSLPRTGTRDRGKTTFVKKFLGQNPQGNVQAVNEAWTKSGRDGSIGATLIHKLRSEMGLTGNMRATSKPKASAKEKAPYTGKKRGRKPKETTAAVNGQPRGRKSDRSLALNELEAEIDRLIFKVMVVGDLTQIEDSLRQARRLIYVALTRD